MTSKLDAMKTVKVLFSAIACGLLLAGCAKETPAHEEEAADNGKLVNFTIKAKALETKTYIDYDSGTKTYTPKWKNGNQIGVFFDVWSKDDPISATFNNTAADGEDAVFSGTGTVKATEQTIYAFYPASSWVSTYSDGIGMNIPDVQRPTETSFDETADLIVNKPYPITIDNASVTIDDMQFARILATLKVVVKDGTASSVLASDKISSITLGSDMTSAALTGRIAWKYESETSEMKVSKASVTADLSANPIAVGNPIYLLVNPITLTKDSKLNITISTDKHEIAKEVTLPKDMEFLQGGVAVLNITVRDTDTIGPAILEPTGTGWYLVQKASWLHAGDKVVITNLASDGALGAASGSIRSKVNVSVTDGKLNVGDATQLTLAVGNREGSWAFKDGDNILYHNGDKSVGTKSDLDDSGSWKITITDSGTKINNVGSNTYYLQYNNPSPRFTDYTGTQQDVRIYKKYSIPELGAITVTLAPDHANRKITVTWDDVEHATGYEVTCTDQPAQNIAPGVEEAIFTGLSYGTEYTITVTASAAGYAPSSDSDAVTLVDPAAKTITRLKASISGVVAAGVTDATETGVYSLTNAVDGDITATPDGTVVTAASVSAGTLTYTVAANAGAARDGSVTLEVAGGNSITVTVSQLAGVLIFTFSNKDLNLTADSPTGYEWSSSKTANSFESSNSARGVQFGAAIGEFTLTGTKTGTGTFAGVKKVTLGISTNGDANKNTVSVSVGSTALKNGESTSYSLPKANNQTVEFSTTTAADGDIVISINDTNKSVYIKTISVE